jgi:hypothetical protein
LSLDREEVPDEREDPDSLDGKLRIADEEEERSTERPLVEGDVEREDTEDPDPEEYSRFRLDPNPGEIVLAVEELDPPAARPADTPEPSERLS